MGSGSSLRDYMRFSWCLFLYQVAANVIEPGENALVLNTGYFGDSFTDWCVPTRHYSLVTP